MNAACGSKKADDAPVEPSVPDLAAADAQVLFPPRSSAPRTGSVRSSRDNPDGFAPATSPHTKPYRADDERGIDAITLAQLESLGYYGGEEFQPKPEPAVENPFVSVSDTPQSTFALNVELASYTEMRRYLENGSVPPVSSLRLEELINFFDYEYESPTGEEVFGVVTELAAAPWNRQHKLLRVGIKAKDFDATKVTVARDVRAHIEFAPSRVQQYRLIGYEGTILSDEDATEAYEISSGHAVTALYEIVTSPGNVDPGNVDPGNVDPLDDELLTLKSRFRQPRDNASRLSSYSVKDSDTSFEASSVDFKFASAVASFGMVLRGSKHQGDTTFDSILEWAKQGRGRDLSGHRAEFGKLVNRAMRNYVGVEKWLRMREALPVSTPRKLILPDSTAGKLLRERD
jgi:hypothetical protein